MPKIRKRLNVSEGAMSLATIDYTLHQQAVDNSLQPNILSSVSSGEIILVNTAACKLLGYTEKELLTKRRSEILGISERNFKKRLKSESPVEHLMVSAIKKNGKLLACEITSAIFVDPDGIKKAIMTIHDLSHAMRKQKTIHNREEKIVADNIILAKTKQKKIDGKKEKIVAGNIRAVKARQRKIDFNKDKITEENIVQALEISDKRLVEQKDKFITIASHELKTPITCLKAYVQLMQIELPAENSVVGEILTKANEQIDKLTRLTNNLLSTAIVEEGKLKYTR